MSPHKQAPAASDPAASGRAAAVTPAFIPPEPRPDGTELCTCFQLRAAARRVSALYARHLAPIGLGLPQFSLIGMAAAAEKQNGRPASISELALALDLDRSTLSRNLRPLVAAGLLDLAPGRHGRAKAVRATSAGRAAYRAGLSLWRAAQDELREGLGAMHPTLGAVLDTTIAATPPAAGTAAANDL